MKNLFIACLILVSSASVITSCKSGETKTSYQCPMKCEGEKTYDKPGECPLCKMELKEVK